MSIYSDYKVGALTDEEFDHYGAIENRRDRWERTHDYIDDFERGYYEQDEDLVIESEDDYL